MSLKKNPGYFALLMLAVLFISLLSDSEFSDKYIVPKNFYFYFLLAPLLATLLIAGIKNKFKQSFSISVLDILVSLYFLYCLVRILFTPAISLYNTEFINHTLLVVVYFCIKFIYKGYTNETFVKHYTVFITGVLILITLNALYGIFQYASLLPSSNINFKLGGSFGNPGPYSNFLVLIFPFCYIVLFNKKVHSGTIYFLAVMGFVSSLIVIPLTNARTSWICFFVSIVSYIIFFHAGTGKILKFLKSKIFIALLLVVFISGFYYVYNLKKDSASGRLFIWEVTLDMIKDKPVFGHGYDSYITEHNNYQAAYFKNNPKEIEKAYLSDNTTYAFNEFLQISSDTGLTGLVIFIFILVSAFMLRFPAGNNDKYRYFIFTASKLLVIAFVFSALFSYPLRSLPSHILLYYALASISAFGESNFKYNFSIEKKIIKYVSYLSVIILVFFYVDHIKKYKAEKQWLKTFKLMRRNDFTRAYKNYGDLYPVMKYNKYFLFNYGAELSIMKRYEEAIEVLNEAMPYLNDVDVNLYLGHAYEETEQWNEAEKCYKQASYIVPFKFFPKYSLAKLYIKMKKENEAVQVAKEIVEMDVKVESELVNNIKREMQDYLFGKSQQDSLIQLK